jgi:hypothetical protein
LAAEKWLKILLAAAENWRLRNVKKIDVSSFLGCCQMDVKPFPRYQVEWHHLQAALIIDKMPTYK